MSEGKMLKGGVEYVVPPLELFEVANKTKEGLLLQKEIAEKLVAYFKRSEINAKIVSVMAGVNFSSFMFQAMSSNAFKRIKQEIMNIEYDLQINNSIRVTEEYRQFKRGVFAGKSVFFENQESLMSRPFMRVLDEGQFITLEIPSLTRSALSFSEAFDMPLYAKAMPSCPTFAIGKNAEGGHEVCHLDKMPHLLIAGISGSGKSSFINNMIASLACKNSPKDLRFLLIDPKFVEYSIYNDMPHSLTRTPICEPLHIINALNFAVNEMKRRFDLLKNRRVFDIKEYNNLEDVLNGKTEKLPYIVICIDEFSSISVTDKKTFEEAIYKLAQMSRAIGIHLVLATQRVSSYVISQKIKANIASRVAFCVSNNVDSRVILDKGGAEKLLNFCGDMLYLPIGEVEPRRVQGLYISLKETQRLVEFLIKNYKSDFDQDLERIIFNS